MHKWRYKVLVIRELALSEAKINAEGEHGWELVSVCMSDNTTARAFFRIATTEEALPMTDAHAGQAHHMEAVTTHL